jgi:hypothetical protein
MSDLRQQIMAISDRKVVPVEVPAWGLTVFVRTLSVLERLNYEKDLDRIGSDAIKWIYLSYSLCDAQGVPAFPPGDLDDLYTRDPFVLDKIFDAAMELLPDDKPTSEGETPEGKS